MFSFSVHNFQVLLQCFFGIIFGIYLAYMMENIVGWLQHLLQIPFHQTLNIKPDLIIPDINSVLYAVMTTSEKFKYYKNIVNNTWGKEISENIYYFVGGDSKIQYERHLIKLVNVNDYEYPPQIKSFSMLKYVYYNFINNYTWIFRLDDDVYVNSRKLEKFIQLLDPTQFIYLGSPGFGKDNEFGKLGLMEHRAYCMGGPGVIISKILLTKIAPFIDKCMNQVVTKHEDTEIGRCILHHANISCTDSYDIKKLFFNVYPNKNIHILDNFWDWKYLISNAISIHPLKSKEDMYVTDYYVTKYEIDNLLTYNITLIEKNMLKTQNKINKLSKLHTCQLFDSNYKQKNKKILFKQLKVFKSEKKNITITSTFQKMFMCKTDRYNNYLLYYNYYSDIWKKNDISLPSIYRVVMSVHGHFKNTSNVLILPSKHITILVPLKERLREYNNFLECISYINLPKTISLHIIFIVFGKNHTIIDNYKTQMYIKFKNNPHSNIQLNFIYLSNNFSRGYAFNYAIQNLFTMKMLILCDIDMCFDYYFIRNCIVNTIENKIVYFPIVFSQFLFHKQKFNITIHSPDISNYIHNDNGIWRHYGYGIVSIYKSDYIQTGGVENLFQWGHEDVNFFNKVIHTNFLEVFRANDPHIIHLYHPSNCIFNTSTYSSCIGSNLNLFGSQKLLYHMLHNKTSY